MAKILDPEKEYKVSGKLLLLLLELSSLYNEPLLIVEGGYCEQHNMLRTNEKIQVMPFQSEKRDYLIGRIAEEVEKSLEQENK